MKKLLILLLISFILSAQNAEAGILDKVKDGATKLNDVIYVEGNTANEDAQEGVAEGEDGVSASDIATALNSILYPNGNTADENGDYRETDSAEDMNLSDALTAMNNSLFLGGNTVDEDFEEGNDTGHFTPGKYGLIQSLKDVVAGGTPSEGSEVNPTQSSPATDVTGLVYKTWADAINNHETVDAEAVIPVRTPKTTEPEVAVDPELGIISFKLVDAFEEACQTLEENYTSSKTDANDNAIYVIRKEVKVYIILCDASFLSAEESTEEVIVVDEDNLSEEVTEVLDTIDSDNSDSTVDEADCSVGCDDVLMDANASTNGGGGCSLLLGQMERSNAVNAVFVLFFTLLFAMRCSRKRV